MLAVIVSWMVITIISFSLGRLFVIVSNRATQSRGGYSFFDMFFIGICVAGAIICITSLFLPSGIFIAAALGLISALYLIYDREYISEYLHNIGLQIKGLTKVQKGLIVFFFLIFISYIILPPQWADTFYYHIQNMMWNEEYRVVPGLANLLEQFGFNSNFFLLSSVFGLKPLFGQYVFGLNALCFLLLFVYVISLIGKTKNNVIVLLSVLMITALYYQYKNHIGSPSTDILPNMVIVYLLINILVNPRNINDKPIIFWLLPVYCITLKLSSIFMCLIIIYLIWQMWGRKEFRQISYIVICSMILVLPWIIRNIIVSGYVIYPFPAIDIFSFDWKLPMEYVVESKDYVKAYAITEKAMNRPNAEVFAWPFMYKLSLWIKEKSLFENAITLLAIVSTLFSIVWLFASKKVKAQDNIPYIIFWLICLSGFLFWMVMAPDVRFGIGFILSIICIPAYFLLKDKNITNAISSATIEKTMVVICLFCLVLSVRYFVSVKDPNKPLYTLLTVPENLDILFDKRFQQMSKQTINNVELYVPKTSCLDCQLPCSPRPVDNLEKRGDSLQHGFRQKKD